MRLADDALAEIARSRDVVDALAKDDRPHYGISTGFGALATTHIPAERRTQLQRSLIRSHAAGSGPEVEREVVRALMLLRLSTLATGRTGVRTETAQAYAAMLDAGLTPVVHEYGSLGCSGDLAPLSSVALALMGEGSVRDGTGMLRPAAEALRACGLEPVELAEKEGLALVNGTDGMLGMLRAGPRRPRPAADDGRRRRGHERRGAAGHRRGVRRRPAAPAPPSGTGRVGGQPAGAAGRQRDHGQPPRARVHPRAGRLLAAVRAPGARRRPRHGGPRRRGGRPRARRGRRQPGDHARRPGRVQRQLPRRARSVTCSTSSPSPSPTSPA